MKNLQQKIFNALICTLLLGLAVSAQERVSVLELKQTSEQNIKVGQTQNFTVNGRVGEYFRIDVEPKNINLSLALFAPDERLIFEMDGGNASWWRETIFHIAETSGIYRIEIKAFGTSETEDKYRIELTELRPSVPKDRKKITAMQLLIEGRKLTEQDDEKKTKEAVVKFETAGAIWRELGETYWEAVTLLNLGWSNTDLSVNDTAITFLNEAAELFRKNSDRKGEAKAVNGLGNVYRNKKEFETAKKYYEQALIIRQEIKDRFGEASTLHNLGLVYNDLFEYNKSLEAHNKALAIRQELKDRNGEADSLSNIASVYSKNQRYREATDFKIRELEIKRELKQKDGESSALWSLGYYSRKLYKYDEALDYYQKSLEIIRELKDRENEAGLLRNIGVVYKSKDDYQKAIESFEQAAAIFKSENDWENEADCLTKSAFVYFIWDNSEKSIEKLEKTLKIYREKKDAPNETVTLFTISFNYLMLRKFNDFHEYYNVAETVIKANSENSSNPFEGVSGRMTSENFGAYSFIGKCRSQDIMNSLGGEVSQGGVLYGECYDYIKSQPLEKSKEEILDSLESFVSSGNFKNPALNCGLLGEVFYSGKNLTQSLNFTKKFNFIVSYYDDQGFYYNARRNLDILIKQSGDQADAIAFYTGLLEVSKYRENKDLELNILTKLSEYSEIAGKYQESINFLEEAVKISGIEKDKINTNVIRIGKNYELLGKPEKSGEYYKKACVIPSNSELSEESVKRISHCGKTLYEIGTPNAMRAAIDLLKVVIEFYKTCETCGKDVITGSDHIFAYISIANIQERLGEKENAFANYQTALEIVRKRQESLTGSAEKSDNKVLEAMILGNIGVSYLKKGENRRALETLLQTKQIFEEWGNLNSTGVYGKSLVNLGFAYSKLGQKEKALAYYEQGQAYFQVSDTEPDAALMLGNIGRIYFDVGRTKEALENFEKSLRISQNIGDKRTEFNGLYNLGAVYLMIGEKDKAIEFINKGIALTKILEDKYGEAAGLTNISAVYKSLGEKQKVLETLDQALQIFKGLDDKESQAAVNLLISAVFEEMGNRPQALKYASESLQIFSDIGEPFGKANALNSIGNIYFSLGDKQKSLELFNEALEINIQIKDKQGEAVSLNNIGAVRLVSGENREALEVFGKVLEIVKLTENKDLETKTLVNIGTTHTNLLNFSEALEFYEQALTAAKELGDKNVEALILNDIGRIHDSLGQNRQAIEFYQKALVIEKIILNKPNEVLTLSNLSYSWNASGNRRLAMFFGKKSVNEFQKLRSISRSLEITAQKLYVRNNRYFYQFLAELAINERNFGQAVQILDHYQDQQFFDFDNDSTTDAGQIDYSPRERQFAEKYDSSAAKLIDLKNRNDKLKRRSDTELFDDALAAELEKSNQETKEATDEFLKLLEDAEAEFSQKPDSADVLPPLKEVVEMKETLVDLSVSTKQKPAAIYTFINENVFNTILLTADGNVQGYETAIKSEEFNEKILSFYALLQSPIYDPRQIGKEIFNVIMPPPLQNELKKRKIDTLMWQLDGNLRYVPMAALFDGKQYLVEKYNNVYFSRSDKERMTRAVNPNWTATGFGTSEEKTVQLLGNQISFEALPGVGEELKMLFKQSDGNGIFTGETLFNAEFSRGKMLNALRSKRPVVHIASHFSFRAGDEARSFLLLGDGTAFTLADMKAETNLFQGVDLLTLSACNTAAQQMGANGREVDGFAELAQRLGANSVMATLWSVADCSTPWLMREFYDLKLNKNQNKAESLRAAQLGLLGGKAEIKSCETRADLSPIKIVIVEKSEDRKKQTETTRSGVYYLNKKDAPLWEKEKHPPFSHPFFWSPFVLFGNWK